MSWCTEARSQEAGNSCFVNQNTHNLGQESRSPLLNSHPLFVVMCDGDCSTPAGAPWPSGLRLSLPISMKATTVICTRSCHGERICPGFSTLRATYGTNNAKCFNCSNVWTLGLVHGFWRMFGTLCECLEISCSRSFHMRS